MTETMIIHTVMNIKTSGELCLPPISFLHPDVQTRQCRVNKGLIPTLVTIYCPMSAEREKMKESGKE
jgi:hypothetical protein